MDKLHKEALQVTKEIVVKFIEVGRVSPANLGEVFPAIYTKILHTISGGCEAAPPSGQSDASDEDRARS
ncbi:hypothetical protein DGI_1398 [Megalodesulfovibrio gigas DSM 1382 = ATCC 19364]|uniref:Uncharacterized protein n=1 Tax=Megalodesulfovibrio gigas (strain ATCC 19364 / DSM 1382 / NCIMB 9332 / VKM B-1759) TaxID=1121448 RepID=T2GAP0_MEGG1|nr:hypothetical protein [Megalodesulfovibrio gigas]AGW13244.1 hypothetical protein DGI_1398 [Megalodesulfovibrio gigas DSM 1382 = ATCC 19364]